MLFLFISSSLASQGRSMSCSCGSVNSLRLPFMEATMFLKQEALGKGLGVLLVRISSGGVPFLLAELTGGLVG
jgi:hypothetical protein